VRKFYGIKALVIGPHGPFFPSFSICTARKVADFTRLKPRGFDPKAHNPDRERYRVFHTSERSPCVPICCIVKFRSGGGGCQEEMWKNAVDAWLRLTLRDQ